MILDIDNYPPERFRPISDPVGVAEGVMAGVIIGIVASMLAGFVFLEKKVTIVHNSLDRYDVHTLDHADTIRFVPGGLGFECKVLRP